MSYGEIVTQDEVSEWCQEDSDGCVFFLALEGLQEEGYDVVPVREEADLRELLTSEDAEPVIITLKNPDPRQMSRLNHAVVVLDIRHEAGQPEVVKYMDPLDGLIHEDTTGFLLQWWDYNGHYGFVIRSQ